MSLTATLLLNKPITFPKGVAREPHYADPIATRAGNWSPSDWAKAKMDNLELVKQAVEDGYSFASEITDITELCHITVRNCLRELSESGEIEKYMIGKRSFYREIVK